MNKRNIAIFAAVAVLVFSLTMVFLVSSRFQTQSPPQRLFDEPIQELPGETPGDTAEEIPETDDQTTPKGVYEDYSPEKITAGTNILFFHATWCSICNALERDINANPDRIPAGTRILKVNFDTALELRQRYGVTIQHTMVKVDAEGNELDQWSTSTSLNNILQRAGV